MMSFSSLQVRCSRQGSHRHKHSYFVIRKVCRFIFMGSCYYFCNAQHSAFALSSLPLSPSSPSVLPSSVTLLLQTLSTIHYLLKCSSQHFYSVILFTLCRKFVCFFPLICFCFHSLVVFCSLIILPKELRSVSLGLSIFMNTNQLVIWIKAQRKL